MEGDVTEKRTGTSIVGLEEEGDMSWEMKAASRLQKDPS